MNRRYISAVVWVLALVGCGHGRTIPGTTVLATETNQEIIDSIENYRMNLVQKNVDGLLLLASDRYFEDGGTPQASDDYGFEGLRTILLNKLQRVQSIRYDVEYQAISIKGDMAEVRVFLNGAFELKGEAGDRYRRLSDIHRFVLQRSASGGSNKWKFLSGM